MGKSGYKIDYASSDRILEVLTGFINNLIHEEFLIIGESYGGYLARGILANFADKINGMMLLCPVVIPQKEKKTLPFKTIKFKDSVFLNQLNESDKSDFCEYAVLANEETYQRYCEEVLKGIYHANSIFINKLKNN